MNRGLIWSGALHAALFVLFLLGPGPKALEWDRADAVAVDLVTLPMPEPPKELPVEAPKAPPSLPDPDPEPEPEVPSEPEVKPAPVEAQPAPAPKTEKPAPPDPAPAKAVTPPPPQRVFRKYAPPQEDNQPSLAERLKERLASAETEPEAAAAPAKDSRPGPADLPEAAETVLPAATSAHVEAVNFPYEWYLNVLRTKITAAWDPPGQRLISGRERQVVIRFRVHRDGRVTQVATDGASGTPGLDDSARRAVERGGPFPPLPPNYEGDWLDVAVRFTVEGV